MNISPDRSGNAKYFADFFRFIPAPALVLSKEGVVLEVNEAARKLIEENLGQCPPAPWPLSKVIADNWMERLSDIQIASPGDIVRLMFGKSGQTNIPQPFSVVTPLSGPSPIDRRIGLILTREQALTDGFSRLNAQLETTNEEARLERRKRLALEGQLENLKDFSYMAAHDLKTPLANIQQLIELFHDRYGAGLPDAAQNMLSMVVKTARRLLHLVGGLLDFGVAQSGELRTEDIDLTAVLTSITEEYSQTLATIGGRVVIPDTVHLVSADPIMVRQLLDNLVGNAIKYRFAGRPLVVTIAIRQDGQQVVGLDIHDNGRGFSADQGKLIFEPFARLVTNSEVEGSGIGLATCVRICNRHGWQISATGEPEEGANFHIDFNTIPPAATVSEG